VSLPRRGLGSALRLQLSLTPVYPAGLSDEQIEGWRIMLERNPRRMASIQARLGMFTPSASATSANSAKPTPVPNGNHTNGNGGGGGGANRGRGGGGDRGGGRGGRGGRGENKGSRGHQNAARKRGADRKAAMQGPKA
jgi:activating signal cointegrator complex subunit 2